MTAYDAISGSYNAGRLGYANDVYSALIGFGLTPSTKILDIACGTGLASGPLIENDYDVTGIDLSTPMLGSARARYPKRIFIEGSALSLPFDAGEFDLAISAQAFHHFDRTVAMREALRVLRPGGILAIWWKHMVSDDPIKITRDQVVRDLGVEPFRSGLIGGFREFYAAPLREHILRVIPWRTTQPLSAYMQYEHSRKIALESLGSKVDAYFAMLEERLRGRSESPDPVLTLSYNQYLYLGKK